MRLLCDVSCQGGSQGQHDEFCLYQVLYLTVHASCPLRRDEYHRITKHHLADTSITNTHGYLHHSIPFHSTQFHSIPFPHVLPTHTLQASATTTTCIMMYYDECEVLSRRGVAFQSPEALAILSALQVGLHTTIKVSG